MQQVKALADRSWSLTNSGNGMQPLTTPPVPAATWTAMAPPARTSAAAPLPVPQTRTFATTPVASVAPGALLDELVATVAGVHSAALASVDGFGIARSSSMSDEASHPAMLAAAVGLAHQLVAMGGGAELRQLVVDHDTGFMLVWPIGEQRVLAVLCASTAEQRQIRSFVQARAVLLAEAET